MCQQRTDTLFSSELEWMGKQSSENTVFILILCHWVLALCCAGFFFVVGLILNTGTLLSYAVGED